MNLVIKIILAAILAAAVVLTLALATPKSPTLVKFTNWQCDTNGGWFGLQIDTYQHTLTEVVDFPSRAFSDNGDGSTEHITDAGDEWHKITLVQTATGWIIDVHVYPRSGPEKMIQAHATLTCPGVMPTATPNS